MDEQHVITPFETGVYAALMLVGKAIAMNPNLDVEDLKKDAQKLIETLPTHPQFVGGRGVHQEAIRSLLSGIDKVKR